MASSLFALLTQQTPNLRTRKGLILLGLQNDFLSPDGKLPVSTESGFLDRLKELVNGFREFGDVIWVRSEFEASRAINAPDESGDSVIVGDVGQGHGTASSSDPDEELFLSKTSSRESCCLPGSSGAEYATQIKEMVDPKKDLEVVKTFYSAFGSTSLLLTLRSRMITELFVCGCNTNLSVFATAMDAARYGISITLVEDCLGYRTRDRHDEAIRQLREIMNAEVMASRKIIDVLRNPRTEEDENTEDDDENDDEDEDVRPGPASASDMIAVGSDEDEDDDDELDLAIVRSSRLPVRSSAPSSNRSQQAASNTSPTQPAKSARTRLPQTFGRPAVGNVEADDRRRRQNGKDSVASASHTASGVGGIGRGVHETTKTGDKKRSRDERRADVPSSYDGVKSQQESTLLPLARTERRDPARINEHTTKQAQRQRDQGDATITMQNSRLLFGEDKEAESAGSRIYYDLLPPELASTIFDQLKDKVDWQRMHHLTGEVPRLVCCQGNIDPEDGSKPLYRHPSDQTLPLQHFTPTVEKVRQAAERVVGHGLNHTLIQLYRGGTDYISEHSDKTLDIVHGSQIVNVSFGAQRVMRLRTKRAAGKDTAASPNSAPQRTTHRVALPHNSMLTMTLATNAEYLHGLNPDKRPACELNNAETAYGGERISLTFRQIGTFLSADDKMIWGQGALGKSKADAKPVISGDSAESEKLVRAFGAENQASSIRWEAVYGGGSDVLHLK